MSHKKELSAWDFVTAFYPRYTSSDEIAHNDDLSKLLDEEQEDGDCASKLLDSEYGGDIRNPLIQSDFDTSERDIFKKAIEMFLELNPDFADKLTLHNG